MASHSTIKFCNLQGGLGNFLFQIAATYSYGASHDKDPIFSLDDAIIIHKPISNYHDNILHKIEFHPAVDIAGYTHYEEPHFHYSDIPYIDGNVSLAGYFQSEKYFRGHRNLILELFDYDIPDTDYKQYLKGDTCSVHVRRGDFLNLEGHHPFCGIDYYQNAFDVIGHDKKYLIFSDDLQWCRDHFIGDNFIFIESGYDFIDLHLMKSCKNNIIGNSTFSWWGAWLNQYKDKKVIVPSRWFGPAKSDHSTADLIPTDWITI